ncbi:MAG: hypothetical protein KDA43_14525 [Hyphomonas sp.]|nr:hypothetical protein [Hyphomonas sp.]
MTKKSITLADDWTFRTPLRTIHFPKGKHSVDEEVHQAAVDAGVTEKKDDGDRDSETGAAHAAGDAEGGQ